MDFNNKVSIGSDDRALAELAQLNRQSLELLRTQAVSGSPAAQAQPIFVELTDLWQTLDPAALARAATCPCLLVDFAFFDARRWTAVARDLVHDQEHVPRFFDAPSTDSVARAILTEVWYYSRMRGSLLGLFGISTAMAGIIGSCTQTQVLRVAEQHGTWLQPRWPDRPRFWRGLLQAALADDQLALRRAGHQGVSMLAAELRLRAQK